MAKRPPTFTAFLMENFMDMARDNVAKFIANPSGTAFLVPPVYGERAREALLAAGFTVRKKACITDAYRMLAWRIGLGPSAKQRKERFALAVSLLFGTSPEECEAIPSLSGAMEILPMVVPKNVTVEIRVKLTDDDDLDAKVDRAAQKQEAVAAYTPMLRRLAQLTGKAVWFHSPEYVNGQTLAPIDEPKDAIHVVSNKTPPGKFTSRNVRKVFGLHVNNGKTTVAHGPTAGRGHVLYDDDGTPVLQIIGNTWYLLLPTLSVYQPRVNDEIFLRLLAKGWQVHAGYTTSTPEPVPASKSKATIAAWGNDMEGMLRKMVEKHERDIVWYQENIARLHREAAMYRELLEGVATADGKEKIAGKIRRDVAALRKEPLVERVDLFANGLHVVTCPIVVTENGVPYDLGSYVIRVDVDRSVSIWSEAPTHPGGVPHPHIPKHGGPCFGNASAAILKASGEFRVLDAVRYVVRWLAEGYQQDLASTKITEWPVGRPMEESHAAL